MTILPEIKIDRTKAWAACNALRACRQELGLSNSVMTSLKAIMSFIVDQGSPIVYAANRTICDRADCTDRTLRRHLRELERHALIRRAASSNGKRYRVRNPDGPDLVFGIDLSPLLARHIELEAMAQEIRDRGDRLKVLRKRIHAALARRGEAGMPVDEAELADLRRLLRRARAPEELAGIAQTLEADLPQASILPASNGQDVRHIEYHQKEEILMSPASDPEQCKTAAAECCEEIGIEEIAERCPEAMSFAIAPVRNTDELRAFGWSLGSMAGIPERLMHQAAARSGLDAVTLAILAIVQRGSRIRNAAGYFRTLFFGEKASDFSAIRMIMSLPCGPGSHRSPAHAI